MGTGAENAVEARDPVYRATARTGVALVAGLVDIGEVVTARALAQIAAGRGAIAQLLCRPGENGARQHRIVAADAVMVRGRGVGDERADAHPAIRCLLDRIHAQPVDRDQPLGRLDLQFHQVEQIGPTRDQRGGFAIREGIRVIEAVGPLEIEWSHAASPCPATSRIAATILA